MIKNAIKKYNSLAVKFNPPRKQLNAKDVLALTCLSDFKLLQETRADILTQKWAQPQIREATTHSLRVLRAREELIRIQVEARRFQTWMRDDIHHIEHTLPILEMADSPLVHILRRRLDHQTSINAVNYTFIRRIEQHHFFSGISGPGSRKKGADLTGFTVRPTPHVPENPETSTSNDESDNDLDDVGEELADLAEGLDRIATASWV
jgi:hypothetical protein